LVEGGVVLLVVMVMEVIEAGAGVPTVSLSEALEGAWAASPEKTAM